MKILNREALERFCRKHADARNWIENWIADVESATWQTPHDVRKIFNVKGNAYRLEVSVAYRTGTVVVEWAGTHSEYDERNRKR